MRGVKRTVGIVLSTGVSLSVHGEPHCFQDDTAADIRGGYRDLIGDGLTGPQATDALVKEWVEVSQRSRGVRGILVGTCGYAMAMRTAGITCQVQGPGDYRRRV